MSYYHDRRFIPTRKFSYQRMGPHTMEKRKGHKVYNFCCKFKISGIFNTYIVFNCSGDDNEPNGYIYMDTFQIDADNLTTTIRDYQLSKLI